MAKIRPVDPHQAEGKDSFYSKYEENIPQRMLEFFVAERKEKVLKKKVTKFNKEGEVESTSEEYEEKPCTIPTKEAFAALIGVDVSTLGRWSRERLENGELKYPEFHLAFRRATDLQKDFLMQNGLAGLYPPSAYIFTAKNITDMRDDQNVDITTNGKDLPVPILGVKRPE